MKNMQKDLGAQKRLLIEEILMISDVELIQSIRSLINQSPEAESGGRMTIEEYFTRIDAAREDVAKGRVTSHEELGNEIGQWKSQA